MTSLHHYCSASAFLSIISDKKIFLSSMLQTNDRTEGKIVTSKILSLIDSDKVSPGHRIAMKHFIQNINEYYQCAAFCLSWSSDLLSQWRGYGDDGSGFSIGFSQKYLRILIENSKYEIGDAVMDNVIYSNEEHEKFAQHTYKALKNVITSIDELRNAKNTNRKIAKGTINETVGLDLSDFSDAISGSSNLFLHKDPAFKEERESRILCNISGRSKGLLHRTAKNAIIPHIELRISNHDSQYQLIQEVILGPKNNTPKSVVRNLLYNNGFSGVKVTKSVAPYQ